MCGEDLQGKKFDRITIETPPCVRGRHEYNEKMKLRLGNTPVCAGKTIEFCHNSPMFEKHPRVCGEDQVYFSVMVYTLETPPCVRGRPILFPWYPMFLRNTPVCAGKTPHKSHDIHLAWKHPRVCGEDDCIGSAIAVLIETPPCVRGRL